MSYLTILLSALFFLPALAGIVALLVPRSNTFVQTLTVLAGLCGLVGVGIFFGSGAGEFVLVPDVLVLLPLSAFFVGIISLGITLTSIFAIGYLPRYADAFPARRVNLASTFFVLGMLGVVFADTLPVFLLAWEVMSVAAYFLVIADRTAESIAAGFIYFVMTQIGFVSLLAGFFMLAAGDPGASWQTLAENAGSLSPFALGLAFFLLLAGFGSKAGLVPLHAWLPYAHPQAPSHASALLSGVMLNVALYGFIRAIFLLPAVSVWWAVVVVVLGLLSAFFGAVHAATERDAKRVLAYSSIENMGLIFSALGMLLVLRAVPPGPGVAMVMSGIALFTALHIVNHFLFKTGLFMAVGAAASGAHSRDLDELGGLAQRWPVFSGVVLALSLAAAALPPLGTFFGEWAYVQALAVAIAALPLPFAAGAIAALSVIALVSGLAVFASIRLFSVAFLGRARTEHAAHAGPLPLSMTVPSAVAAALLLVTSVVTVPLFSHLDPSALFADLAIARGASVNAWLVVGFFVLVPFIVIGIRMLLAPARIRVTDTWDCGQPITPGMQYTATGFAAPIRFFFRAFVLATKRLVRTPILPSNQWIARRSIEWSIGSVWERWLYVSVARGTLGVAGVVRKLQNGVVQAYLLIVLITLIATILYAL